MRNDSVAPLQGLKNAKIVWWITQALQTRNRRPAVASTKKLSPTGDTIIPHSSFLTPHSTNAAFFIKNVSLSMILDTIVIEEFDR